MPNGVHALQSLTSEPSHSPVDQPINEIDVQLGEAVAAGAWVISAAVDNYRQTGALAASDKATSADRIAAVAMLALDHAGGDEAFFEQARAAGKDVLRQCVKDGCSPQRADTVIDIWVDELLQLVATVVRQERAIRAAWAN